MDSTTQNDPGPRADALPLPEPPALGVLQRSESPLCSRPGSKKNADMFPTHREPGWLPDSESEIDRLSPSLLRGTRGACVGFGHGQVSKWGLLSASLGPGFDGRARRAPEKPSRGLSRSSSRNAIATKRTVPQSPLGMPHSLAPTLGPEPAAARHG
jgi:hypothetical protein